MADKITTITIFIIGGIYLFTLMFCATNLCHGMNIQNDERDNLHYVSYKPIIDEENQVEQKVVKGDCRIRSLKLAGKLAFITCGISVGCIIMSHHMSSEEGFDYLQKGIPIFGGIALGNIAAEGYSEWVDWLMRK